MAERFRHPDPDKPGLAPLREAHAATSPDSADHWPAVYRKVCAMALGGPSLRPADVARVRVPALVVVGDDDVVSHRHTVALYERLPDAQLAIVPGTSHLLPEEAPGALEALVTRFLDGPPPKRLMPMRRQPSSPA